MEERDSKYVFKADEDVTKLSVDELKEYAQEAGIDLKGVTRKADMIAAIRKAM